MLCRVDHYPFAISDERQTYQAIPCRFRAGMRRGATLPAQIPTSAAMQASEPALICGTPLLGGWRMLGNHEK
jgi:hypothetical protein